MIFYIKDLLLFEHYYFLCKHSESNFFLHEYVRIQVYMKLFFNYFFLLVTLFAVSPILTYNYLHILGISESRLFWWGSGVFPTAGDVLHRILIRPLVLGCTHLEMSIRGNHQFPWAQQTCNDTCKLSNNCL